MGQILAWHCERSGQLFVEESDYLKHTRKLNRALALEARAARQRELEVAAIQPMFEKRTFRALENWIVKNHQLIRAFGRRVSSYGSRHPGNLVYIRFHSMRWGEQSCSHNAPLGKPTNWSKRDPNLPSTYLGWRGRVDMYFDDYASGETDGLTEVGICTGSGGGGGGATKKYPRGYYLSYDVILWGDDFPKLIPSGDMLLQENSFGGRTVESLFHDLFHYQRSSVENRIKKWADFNRDILTARSFDRELYANVRHANNREERINLLALTFAKDFPYYVEGLLKCYKARGVIDRMKRDGKVANLSGLGAYTAFLTRDAEMFVGWKFDGSLSGDASIIDLKARAKTLKGISA
jgi:hypothetical protein